MSATLKNTQAVPLSISSIAISGGTAPADYVAGGNCPLRSSTLGPGENCHITVTFTPSAPGMRTATLTVTDNARTSPPTVALTGMGMAAVDLPPSSSNLGGPAVGNTSVTPSVTLTNDKSVAPTSSSMAPSRDMARGRPGTLPSRASGSPSVIPLSGAGNANGLISITVTPANPSISLGQTQQFTATGLFRGGSTQNLTASVAWGSSAPGVATINSAGLASSVSAGSTTITATWVTITPFGPATGVTPGTPIINRPTSNVSGSTTLTVTGTAPEASLLPTSLTFTSQNVSTASLAQTVTLNNTGNAALSISSIAFTGADPGDFGETTTCGSSVAASSNCTINVAFAPTAPGTRTATLTITDNSNNVAGSQQSVSLTGTGTGPAVSFNPSSLTFGPQAQGTTSTAQGITLTNTGNADLTFTSISVTGANAGDFAQTNTCVSPVAANGTCTINVTFTPTAPGPRTASVSITDNAAGSPQTVGLTGTGAAPLTINTQGRLPDGTVGIPYTFALTATGGTGGYTWSIVSGAGSLPPCLSLANFLINGTPVNTCLGSFSFTVKVTDSASNTMTQPLTININPASSTVCESGNESVLKGQYAFSLIGYRGGNAFLGRVGAFTADGAGNITGGEFDRNTTGSSPANFTLTASTYTVGADNRGCAKFKTTSGSFSTRFVLEAIPGSPGTATQGRIIEFDPPTSSAFIATGQILQQTTATTPSASSFSALSGGYVHLLTGWDTTGSGGRIACDGVKTDTPTTGGAGNITNGEQYCNDEGNAPSGPTTGITGSYTGVDNYGRYTETVGTTNLVGYMVSTAGTGALEVTTSVSSSNTTILAGQDYQQSGSFSASSLDAPMVLYANGVNNSTSGKIQFSLFSADGNGTLTLNAGYENDGGTWTKNADTGSCTYTVATNGGVSGTCGSEFYLTAANTGVSVGSDAGGFAGYMMPQTVPTGGFTSVSGTFFGATAEIINQSAEADEDIITLSSSGSNLSGTDIGDASSTFYQQADNVSAISGATLGSNGIITATENGSPQAVAVAIDQQHFLSPSQTDCSGSPTCYPTISVLGPSTADTVAVTINGVSSSSASVQAGTPLGLTLSVTGTSNTGVTWTLNGITNGSGYSGYGTISGSYPSFTYTPPTRVPQPATFTITATSNADVSQSASVSVTISAGAAVSPLSITTTSLPSGTVGTTYIQNIQTSGGTLPINWSVTSGSLPPGFLLQGTPNGVGMIHGFPRATGTYTFTVKASDSSTPTPLTASQSLSITINNPPLSITTPSVPPGTVGTFYNQTVGATGGTQPYTWSYTGSLPPGLSWTPSTGPTWVLSGTPTTAGTFNFTVTVTDSTLPTHQTVNQPLSLTINSGAAVPCADSGSESLLSGQYAFSLSGFNSTGYLAVVGSFTADGHGNITAGEVDSNGALGVQSASITTSGSSYSVGSNHLGCATIVTTFGTFNTRLSLGSIVSTVATEGRMVEWDAPASSAYFAATGQILQQTAPTAALSGSYAFEESGVDGSNGRQGMVGVMSASGGSFSTGEMDANDAGTTSTITGVAGTYGSADSNGRYTITMTAPAEIAGSTAVGYMVSSSDSVFLSGGDSPMVGAMKLQSGTFSNSSLSGNMVIYDTGLSSNGSKALLGIVNADGTDSVNFTLYVDSAGTWKTPNPQTATCTYSVASNGRMTFSGSGCPGLPPIFYLTTANTAFEVGTDENVEVGQVEPQTAPSGGFTTASFSGTYYMGDGEVVSYGVASAESVGVGVLTLNVSGGFSFIGDYTATNGQQADQTQTGTLGTVNSNGTFSTNSNGVINAIMISTTEFVSVDSSGNTYPIILVGKQ